MPLEPGDKAPDFTLLGLHRVPVLVGEDEPGVGPGGAGEESWLALVGERTARGPLPG